MAVLIFVIIIVLCWFSIRRKRMQRDIERARIANLIELQNYLTGVKSASLDMSEKELLRALKQYVHRRSQIMQDCQNILNKTKSPKTFFSRLDLFMETKKELEGLEAVKPGTLQMKFATDDQFTILKNEMIDRFWMDCVEKSINAASPKGKDAKIKAFFETLALYSDRLSQENQDHIESYRQEAMDLFIKHSITL